MDGQNGSSPTADTARDHLALKRDLGSTLRAILN